MTNADMVRIPRQHHHKGGRRTGGDVECAMEDSISGDVGVPHESQNLSVVGLRVGPKGLVGKEGMEVPRGTRSGHVG